MKTSYLALLRGINVGGNNMIKMIALKAALETYGLDNVRTYIQSGNVLFDASGVSTDELTEVIHDCIARQFQIDVRVAVLSKLEWQAIIAAAPPAWGKDPTWKHNLLVMLKPYEMSRVVETIGVLKPEIELLVPGHGVLYQSVSLKLFGRATTSELASSPVYKQMTIRNYNTATKLLALL